MQKRYALAVVVWLGALACVHVGYGTSYADKFDLLKLIPSIVIQDGSGGGETSIFIIPDTGINTCSDADSEITCPSSGNDFYGQDAQYNSAARQRTFTDNGDGTVTDSLTGQMWMQSDDGVERNWQDAIDYCENLSNAGYSDWRLPDVKELYLLADRGRYPPAIDPVFSSQSQSYWSSSPDAGNTDSAWGVNFSGGSAGYSGKYSNYYVRCVRGGSLPTWSFQDNGEGTVTDSTTGLDWQKSDDGEERTWKDALSYCEALTLGGHNDWRLPDANELLYLVDHSGTIPVIDPVFTSQLYSYWSSSPYAGGTDDAWYVNFSDGGAGNHGKYNNNYVRCVRGGP